MRPQDSIHSANMGNCPGLGPVSEQMAFFGPGPCLLTVKRMLELYPGETNPYRE